LTHRVGSRQRMELLVVVGHPYLQGEKLIIELPGSISFEPWRMPVDERESPLLVHGRGALSPAALHDGAPRPSGHDFRLRLMGPLGHGIRRRRETFGHTPFLVSHVSTCLSAQQSSP
jgi:hypothetical protein